MFTLIISFITFWMLNIFTDQNASLTIVVVIIGCIISIQLIKYAISFTIKLVLFLAITGFCLSAVFVSFDYFSLDQTNVYDDFTISDIDNLIVEDDIILFHVVNDNCPICILNKYTAFNRSNFKDYINNNNVILIEKNIKHLKDSNIIEEIDSTFPVLILFSMKNPSGRILNRFVTAEYLITETEQEKA